MKKMFKNCGQNEKNLFFNNFIQKAVAFKFNQMCLKYNIHKNGKNYAEK